MTLRSDARIDAAGAHAARAEAEIVAAETDAAETVAAETDAADARGAGMPGLPYAAAGIPAGRLVLRPMSEHEVHAHRGRRGIDTRRYWEVRDRDQASGRRRRPITTRVERDGDELILSVELPDAAGGAPRIAGAVSVYLMSAAEGAIEVGWVLHPAAHGQGLALDAVRALMGLCFDRLGAHRVTAQLDTRNEASARLCSELGMRREGVFVADQLVDGDWADTAAFAMLDREWAAAS